MLVAVCDDDRTITDNAIKENKQTTKRSVQLEKNSKPTDRCLL